MNDERRRRKRAAFSGPVLETGDVTSPTAREGGKLGGVGDDGASSVSTNARGDGRFFFNQLPEGTAAICVTSGVLMAGHVRRAGAPRVRDRVGASAARVGACPARSRWRAPPERALRALADVAGAAALVAGPLVTALGMFGGGGGLAAGCSCTASSPARARLCTPAARRHAGGPERERKPGARPGREPGGGVGGAAAGPAVGGAIVAAAPRFRSRGARAFSPSAWVPTPPRTHFGARRRRCDDRRDGEDGGGGGRERLFRRSSRKKRARRFVERRKRRCRKSRKSRARSSRASRFLRRLRSERGSFLFRVGWPRDARASARRLHARL